MGGRPKAALAMPDRFLHLRFQTPGLLPILSSGRSPHQLIAHGFQLTLLHQARHMITMQVLLGGRSEASLVGSRMSGLGWRPNTGRAGARLILAPSFASPAVSSDPFQ